jgi:hypothetical protein
MASRCCRLDGSLDAFLVLQVKRDTLNCVSTRLKLSTGLFK